MTRASAETGKVHPQPPHPEHCLSLDSYQLLSFCARAQMIFSKISISTAPAWADEFSLSGSWEQTLLHQSHGAAKSSPVLSCPPRRPMRKIAAHQITASDLNAFTNTFLINVRMKFVMTITTKSGDELISLKETVGLCEGRAEQHYYIPVRAT